MSPAHKAQLQGRIWIRHPGREHQPDGLGDRRGDDRDEALANAGVPAAIVGVSEESSLENLDDLMDAEVRAVNLPAVQRRVEVGMPGREALNRM
jgi:hypothetical protein